MGFSLVYSESCSLNLFSVKKVSFAAKFQYHYNSILSISTAVLISAVNKE